MRGAATKLKHLSLAAGLLLGACAQVIAGEAKFPIDVAHGTPLACAYYNIGGAESVVSGGGGAATFVIFPEGKYDESERMMLVEPTALTSIELRCTVVASRGNDVDLDCGMLDVGVDADFIETVSVKPVEGGLELPWDKTYLLKPCQP